MSTHNYLCCSALLEEVGFCACWFNLKKTLKNHFAVEKLHQEALHDHKSCKLFIVKKNKTKKKNQANYFLLLLKESVFNP